MNCEHLTDDELIVAVAEAKGWKLSKVARVNGQDAFIAESPTGSRDALLISCSKNNVNRSH